MEDQAAGSVGMIPVIISIVVSLLMLISIGKVFAKAGQPGWAVIVPIYNLVVMVQVAGKPIWWFLLMFIPVVNFVIGIILLLEISKKFGKSGGFAVGLLFLPVIFWPILGFGSAQYEG